MIKHLLAALGAASLLTAPAVAGPYANVEANAGWVGTDSTGSATDMHVGYEGTISDSVSYYVQGGGTYLAPDGAASDVVPSGKAGLSIAATERLNVYGEASFTGSGSASVDRSYGGKLGVKYNF